jgi:predicted Zn-dependent protease
MKSLLLLSFALLFVSCATHSPQTNRLVKDHMGLAKKAEVKGVANLKQNDSFCGPASVAMVMNHAGKNISQNHLASQMFTPNARGSFKTDLVTAIRREGMLAVKVTNMDDLLMELQNQKPVLVYQNLGLASYPIWHYSVVTGYSFKGPYVWQHTGEEEVMKTNMKIFEENWAKGDYWGMIVLNPGEISVTGNDLSYSEGAAGLEQVGKMNEAHLVYDSILKKWPDSLVARIGLGNIFYTAAKYKKSSAILREATVLHPKAAVAWHNYAVAESARKHSQIARESAKKAMELANPEEEPYFKVSLKELLN